MLSKQLADQAVVRTGLAAQMPRMGLLLRTGITVCIGLMGLLVMMERRKQNRRQDNQQQDSGSYASFLLHSEGKDTICNRKKLIFKAEMKKAIRYLP